MVLGMKRIKDLTRYALCHLGLLGCICACWIWTSEDVLGQEVHQVLDVERGIGASEVPSAEVLSEPGDADADNSEVHNENDNDSYSHGEFERMVLEGKTWIYSVLGIDACPSPENVIDPAFARMLGFDDDGKASEDTLSRIKSFAQDNALDTLLTLYDEYLKNRDVSQAALLDDSQNVMFETKTLAPLEKIGIALTLAPYLLRHAAGSNDLVSIRKIRERVRTMERVWPDRQYDILCWTTQSAMYFPLSSLEPGSSLSGVQVELNLDSGDLKTPQCTVFEHEQQSARQEKIQSVLGDALTGLSARDNDLIIDAMGQLAYELDALWARYGYDASWNHHWDSAPVEEWICQIQVICLLALEQHRFTELARLERSVNRAFSGSTFYRRLTEFKSCKTRLSGSFLSAADQLNERNASSYAWIIKQFEPKNIKKLDKAFAAWVKKGTKPARLSRQLLASWTAWSLGDYERAAKYAGNVIENRSRIVHPQLHSFDMMLKAIRQEDIPRESLETYVRVIRLKSPQLVYQTFSESARWWKPEMRRRIVDVMRQYSPSHAPVQAAQFYVAYEAELRENMNARHRIELDAWIEKELRATETAMTANRRRLQWLGDLIDDKDWKGIEKLSALSMSDIQDGKWSKFWHVVSKKAHAAATGEKADADELWPEFDACQAQNGGTSSVVSWFGAVPECLKK